MTAPVTRPDWPDGPLLTYYGDDFTGSTDVLEAMTVAGLPSVLYLKEPSPEMLRHFPDARCVGLAGDSRSRSPGWMDRELPRAFASLARLGAPILQYKVCSTFDSSPSTGSIGRAIDLGMRHARAGWSPCVVGAPRLGRYQAFGQLFATVGEETLRLDRHPTMSRHPVTPMDECDLSLHLSRQTDRPIGRIDLLQLRQGRAAARLAALREQADAAPIVFIDVIDEETQRLAGELIWSRREGGLFSASSSGLQDALTACWRARGLLPAPQTLPRPRPVDVVAAVSGSCSPVTAAQLVWARRQGFELIRLDIPRLLGSTTIESELADAVARMVAALKTGRSAIAFSAEGPDDPAVVNFDAASHAAGLSRPQASRRIGEALARVLTGVLERIPVPRVAVAGGDSAGVVTAALGIDALTATAAMAPGAPLCLTWSHEGCHPGLEIVLKGGQMGDPGFFGRTRG